ncbi:MAG: 5-(carboxyamino)imidazole ribonucleotide synthase [Pseudomonadota bacterium]
MRIGIIGGGQLGRMLAVAGIPLGLEFTFLDPGDTPCATALGQHVRAAFDDVEALQTLRDTHDAVTFEFENVPAVALAAANAANLHPPVDALLAAQDRDREKSLFEQISLPVAPWRSVNDQAALEAAVADLGLPLIAKTRTLGYDGKGQKRLREEVDVTGAFEALGGVPLLVERLVDFDYELSIVGTRAQDGAMVIYPMTRNTHINGILHRSERMDVKQDLRRQAHRHLTSLAEALDYVGTLALECFVCDNLLLGNEFAPRVHNTGHWSIDGTSCSQFENHVRAVAGLPLGRELYAHPAGMLNLVGALPEASSVLGQPGCFWHDYGKSPRAGRKLGHINVIGSTQSQVTERLDMLERELGLIPAT